MTRFFDWLVEIWDRLRGLLGFHRLTKKGRGEELVGHGFFWRLLYFIRPVLLLIVLIYLGAMIWRFSWIRGEDLSYPQSVIATPAPERGETGSGGTAATSGTAATQSDGDEAAAARTCAPSQIVRVQQALIDLMVNRNDWVPATPQYKLGFFGLIGWDATPFFDNKASFQRGVIGAVRRMSVELTDTLGRVRGTSGADPDLESARGLLQRDENTWIFNPFDDRLPLLATSAASSYRSAIERFENYNQRLAGCDALFDARADNLFQLFDRVTRDLGSTVDQIARRSQGRDYDVARHEFVDGQGNNRGWFDLYADNYFHEARGRMFAYHGLLQAARADFADVIVRRDLADVWDRMEAHVAEAAVLAPLIVSNGREDGLFTPDHLSVMAENILRARANMSEIREILAR